MQNVSEMDVSTVLEMENALDRAFAGFLRLDVANGDASPDTVRGYRVQVVAWIAWCKERRINPATVTSNDVKLYRETLVVRGYKPRTIALKLVVLRRFYQSAVNAGLRSDNPAAGVRPPRDKRTVDDFGYLIETELTSLFGAVPKTGKAKDLRDLAILGMMGLQGLRTVEIHRANIEDLKEHGDYTVLLVRGKGHERIAYLRSDVAEALKKYLTARGEVVGDASGKPLFTVEGNRARGKRISRRGIRLIVDSYLRQIGLKQSGISNHALRHTAGTLAYRYSHDLRAVQDMLGHADPKTTARYARIVDMAKTNPVLAVPVSL